MSSLQDGWRDKVALVLLLCLLVSNSQLISSLSNPNFYLLKIDSEMSQEMANDLGRRPACTPGVQLQPVYVHPTTERPEPGIWLPGRRSLNLFCNGLKGQETQKSPVCESSY